MSFRSVGRSIKKELSGYNGYKVSSDDGGTWYSLNFDKKVPDPEFTTLTRRVSVLFTEENRIIAVDISLDLREYSTSPIELCSCKKDDVLSKLQEILDRR